MLKVTLGKNKHHPSVHRQTGSSSLQNVESESAQKDESLDRGHITVGHSYSGPLPSPQSIALYNQHIPDGANRIMRMAEKQSEHRITVERAVISAQQKQSGRGQIFGLMIGLFGISAGSIVTLRGHDWVGATIVGTTVVSLVYAFVTGKRIQQRDLAKKQ